MMSISTHGISKGKQSGACISKVAVTRPRLPDLFKPARSRSKRFPPTDPFQNHDDWLKNRNLIHKSVTSYNPRLWLLLWQKLNAASPSLSLTPTLTQSVDCYQKMVRQVTMEISVYKTLSKGAPIHVFRRIVCLESVLKWNLQTIAAKKVVAPVETQWPSSSVLFC